MEFGERRGLMDILDKPVIADTKNKADTLDVENKQDIFDINKVHTSDINDKQDFFGVKEVHRTSNILDKPDSLDFIDKKGVVDDSGKNGMSNVEDENNIIDTKEKYRNLNSGDKERLVGISAQQETVVTGYKHDTLNSEEKQDLVDIISKQTVVETDDTLVINEIENTRMTTESGNKQVISDIEGSGESLNGTYKLAESRKTDVYKEMEEDVVTLRTDGELVDLLTDPQHPSTNADSNGNDNRSERTVTHERIKSVSQSPKAGFSEIEDERKIRIESPLRKRETSLSEPQQDDGIFDIKDLSFFDTPVHTQTYLGARILNTKSDESERPDVLDKPISTPQGPVPDTTENLDKDKCMGDALDNSVNGDSDSVVDRRVNEDENHKLELNHKADIKDSINSGVYGDIKEHISIGEKRENTVQVGNRHRFDNHSNATENKSQNIKMSVESQSKTIYPSGEEVLTSRNPSDKTIKSRTPSSVAGTNPRYEDDFEEEDYFEEKENSRLKLTDKLSKNVTETLQQKDQDSNKSPDLKINNGNLLIEDISSADMFERKRTKSSMPVSEIPPVNLKDKGVETVGDLGRMKYETNIQDKVQTFKMDSSDTGESEQKEQESKTPHSKEKKIKSDEVVNPYFTGRLPSLVIDEEGKSVKAKEISDHYKDDDAVRKLDYTSEQRDEDNETSENRSTSRILELIQEINAPAQHFQMTKERPLTPKTPTDKRSHHEDDKTFLSGGSTVQVSPRADGADNNKQENTDTFNVEKSKMKVGDIDHLTSSMMHQYAKKEAPASAKFENFPHIHEISEYNKANKLAHVPEKAKTGTDDRKETSEQAILKPQSAVRKVYSREKSDHSEYQTLESTTVVANQYKETSHSGAEEQMLNPNKRSSSENDLKAVVASAKRAYGQELTSSSSVLPPITREATIESEMPNIKTDNNETVSSQRTTRVSDDSAHVLICSNCLNQDSNIESAGFCRECQQYLCGNCVKLHRASRHTKRHEIMIAYCVTELGSRKYVKATGYCVDCQHFLCMKCVIQHTGYRRNRYHRIIQSSFISKPKKKPDRSPRTEVHAALPQNDKASKEVPVEKSERDLKKSQAKKKIIKDIEQDNPYRVPFKKVPESLYPGPNKKLAISYADHPKWPQASVPKLPYLVKPKSLQERAFQTPYVSYQKSAFYTDTKTAFEPNRLKLRTLQARYATKTGDNRQMKRRKEEGLFTARRERISDGASLPDIKPNQTTSRTQKEERPAATAKATGVKKAKLLKDYCVSVPFPSGEKQADILGMACLPNGQILIADRQNNNIKLYTKQFKFKAMVQFTNRLTGVCASNLCPVDLYVATQKHIFEITTMRKGLEVQKKIKVDVKRIEGLTCWKYGLAVIHKKTNLTWEVKLMDYRGNSKSKLEIVNPFTQEIDDAPVCYVTTIKGGKRIILTDTRNSCMICTDVTSRCVLYETTLPDVGSPSYVTSDNQHNVFVSCTDKIQQLSKEGNNVGAVITKPDEVKAFGCILYNRTSELLYVQTARDFVSVYQMS